MAFTDWLILGIFTISTLVGTVRGFLREALSLATLIAAIVVARVFGPHLSALLVDFIEISSLLQRDIKLLILDEPTASLDAETEKRVMQNIAEWGKDRIIFIITHRLSTIKTADCIAVLESGVIEEVGTHIELLELNKGYSEFVRSEMGEL